ncbi:MAG: hypothetical protein QW520_02730 [Methanomassiliicoccales archaeon]
MTDLIKNYPFFADSFAIIYLTRNQEAGMAWPIDIRASSEILESCPFSSL